MKTIETLGSQTFSVPNTEEGQLFIELCHKFLNRTCYSIRKYNRAKDRKEKYQKMVDVGVRSYVPHSYHRNLTSPPMPFCDWVAVYFPKHSYMEISRRANKIKAKRNKDK